MATRRLSIFLAGALAIGVGAAWVASDFRPVPPKSQTCRLGVPYTVEVQKDQATFDLPFDANTRYRVIVSSLASRKVASRVTLSAERVSHIERFPLREVPPLQSAIPQQFHTTWNSAKHVPLHKDATPSPMGNPSERTFFLHVTDGPLKDPRQYAEVTACRVAEGQSVRVFLDSNMRADQLAHGLVAEIVRLFDEKILPKSRDVLGEFRDVDGDGKFAILISPWLGKLQGGKTALGGFVRGSDFEKSVEPPFGNQADVMYLNAKLRPGRHLHSLLAHEFAHAICFSRRLPSELHPQGLPTEEDWLNEAIAHLAENLHETGWSNLDYRVSRFLDATHRSPLVVENYYANGLWRDPGCRGATYLFLRWVVDQLGDDVLARLIESPGRGIANLETSTGVAFDDLFRGWTIALATAGRRDSPAQPPEAYTSLNLHQPLGRWSLQGARAAEWNLNTETAFSLRGSTTKMLDVQADSPGVYRLRIRSEGHPQLQVTVIRLDGDSPALQASASWQIAESPREDRPPKLQLETASPWKILRVSVECRQGKHRQSACFAGEPIRFRRQENGAGLKQTDTIELPTRLFPRQKETTASWQVKILAEDSQGRRAANWIELSPPDADKPSHPPLPVAAKSDRELR